MCNNLPATSRFEDREHGDEGSEPTTTVVCVERPSKLDICLILNVVNVNCKC